MTARLLPEFAAYECVRFGGGDRFAEIVIPPELDRAVPKRRLEFAAGRHCARLALGRLAPESAQTPVSIGAHRAPVWPPGILGSITHSRGFAAAAVVRSERALGIGIDTEELVSGADFETVSAEVATAAELRALEGPLTSAQLLTAVFSAKESVFKALFPTVGRYFEFGDVTIVEVDRAACRFTAQLGVDLGSWKQGTRLEGRFAISDDLLHTALVIPAR